MGSQQTQVTLTLIMRKRTYHTFCYSESLNSFLTLPHHSHHQSGTSVELMLEVILLLLPSTNSLISSSVKVIGLP